MSEEHEQDSQALIPAEQDTITFHGKSLIVVRLPDGRNGVVVRWLCENLNLSSAGQIERIKRTEAIADDLVYVRIETSSAVQNMATVECFEHQFRLYFPIFPTSPARSAIRTGR